MYTNYTLLVNTSLNTETTKPMMLMDALHVQSRGPIRNLLRGQQLTHPLLPPQLTAEGRPPVENRQSKARLLQELSGTKRSLGN